MNKTHSQDAMRFLLCPEYPEAMIVHVIRTKRKTVEVSCAPYLMEAYIRCPKDTSFDGASKLFEKHANFLRKSIARWAKGKYTDGD